MQIISSMCSALIIAAIFTVPILFVIFIIRWCMRKSKWFFGIAVIICLGSILPLTLIGTFTDPATYCKHEFTITQEKASSCTERGKIVKKCSLCDRVDTEYTDKLSHNWETDTFSSATCTSGGYLVERCAVCNSTQKIDTEPARGHSWVDETEVLATCTSGGYLVEKCSACDTTQETNTEPALGHSMKEILRVEATYESDGKVTSKCERCDYEESVKVEKLKSETITFDGLEMTFGQYSFTEVNNRYSEHNGKTVVKIPVTIKNVSKEPHSLNMFYYELFGSSGIESDNVSSFFTDDIIQGGDLLPDSSYTKYFHIIYDGDGVYTVVFSDLWYEKETVEIMVQK